MNVPNSPSRKAYVALRTLCYYYFIIINNKTEKNLRQCTGILRMPQSFILNPITYWIPKCNIGIVYE